MRLSVLETFMFILDLDPLSNLGDGLREILELSGTGKEAMAEGVGFEPTGRVNGRRFSRPLL